MFETIERIRSLHANRIDFVAQVSGHQQLSVTLLEYLENVGLAQEGDHLVIQIILYNLIYTMLRKSKSIYDNLLFFNQVLSNISENESSNCF